MVTAGNEASFKIDSAYAAIHRSNATQLVRSIAVVAFRLLVRRRPLACASAGRIHVECKAKCTEGPSPALSAGRWLSGDLQLLLHDSESGAAGVHDAALR